MGVGVSRALGPGTGSRVLTNPASTQGLGDVNRWQPKPCPIFDDRR
jgi:hypothetical protein